MDGDEQGMSPHLREISKLATAGYAMAFHLRFMRPTFLYQSYPKQWLETYAREGLLLRDPTVIWGFAHTGTIRWSELADPDRVIARAAEHGLRHGLTVALLDRGSRSIASFVREDRDFDPGEADLLVREVRTIHQETSAEAPPPEGSS
jgi:LuxR family transcriptional regulator, quorum-sensing system regulator SdiA